MKTSELTGKALSYALGWVEKLGQQGVALMVKNSELNLTKSWEEAGTLIIQEEIPEGLS